MLRKIALIVVIVIVLVSLNWFKVLVARDLNSISDEQKQRLRQHYEQAQPEATGPDHYRTPQIYEESAAHSRAAMPTGPDSGFTSEPSGIAKHDRSTGIDSTIRRELPSFDELRPFGAEFFESLAEAELVRDVATQADYVLGPGDQILIYLWGRVEKQFELTIDREGKVFIPTIGELPAWGTPLSDFEKQATRAFEKAYSDFDLTCSLGKIRSIRVYVTGEVHHPGAYTVTSLTSLFNALALAGGPNERGSMRRIKLMRAGQCAAVVDLYKLLLAGDNSPDTRLESGDVIFVPVVGDQVAVRGQVKRSALYELSGGERAVDLLALAGQPTAQAYLKRVMLERIDGRDEWEVIDLNLDQASGSPVDNIALADGDRLTVFTVYQAKRNLVGIFGQVKHPGYYERTDSTCLSHILDQAQLPGHNVFYERADLFRHHPDGRVEIVPVDLRAIVSGEYDLAVDDRDSIQVYPVDERHPKRRVYIEGAVKNPGWYPLYEKMSVADLVFLAGSFERRADQSQAELASIDGGGDISLRYVTPVGPGADQILLGEDDHLFIRSVPEWRTERTVTVEGEVVYPGEYILSSSQETLYQLLKRTGGFTSNAFPTGLILRRSSIEQALRSRGVSDLLERTKVLASDSSGNVSSREVLDYDLGSMNRVILDIDLMLASAGRQGDVVLEAGDHITVPSVPTGIPVMGAVGSNGTLSFVPNQKVKHYIERAGNFARQADEKHTRLIRADGEVFSGGSVLGKQAQLGDIIVVPTRIQRERDWNKTITTAVSALTGLLTSVFIISNL